MLASGAGRTGAARLGRPTRIELDPPPPELHDNPGRTLLEDFRRFLFEVLACAAQQPASGECCEGVFVEAG